MHKHAHQHRNTAWSCSASDHTKLSAWLQLLVESIWNCTVGQETKAEITERDRCTCNWWRTQEKWKVFRCQTLHDQWERNGLENHIDTVVATHCKHSHVKTAFTLGIKTPCVHERWVAQFAKFDWASWSFNHLGRQGASGTQDPFNDHLIPSTRPRSMCPAFWSDGRLFLLFKFTNKVCTTIFFFFLWIYVSQHGYIGRV